MFQEFETRHAYPQAKYNSNEPGSLPEQATSTNWQQRKAGTGTGSRLDAVANLNQTGMRQFL